MGQPPNYCTELSTAVTTDANACASTPPVLTLPVSVNKTLLWIRIQVGSSVFKNKSGAGLKFLLLDCRARACTKGVFSFTDTGMPSIRNMILSTADGIFLEVTQMGTLLDGDAEESHLIEK